MENWIPGFGPVPLPIPGCRYESYDMLTLVATSCIRDLVLRTDVDLVIIDSAPPTHVQIATNALGIGKHVVCSLPGGLHLRDARRMHKGIGHSFI